MVVEGKSGQEYVLAVKKLKMRPAQTTQGRVGLFPKGPSRRRLSTSSPRGHACAVGTVHSHDQPRVCTGEGAVQTSRELRECHAPPAEVKAVGTITCTVEGSQCFPRRPGPPQARLAEACTGFPPRPLLSPAPLADGSAPQAAELAPESTAERPTAAPRQGSVGRRLSTVAMSLPLLTCGRLH